MFRLVLITSSAYYRCFESYLLRIKIIFFAETPEFSVNHIKVTSLLQLCLLLNFYSLLSVFNKKVFQAFQIPKITIRTAISWRMLSKLISVKLQIFTL